MSEIRTNPSPEGPNEGPGETTTAACIRTSSVKLAESWPDARLVVDANQGFSMTQLIETSLISAHFADASCAIYLDVFSCAPYEPEEVAEFAKEYFKAAKYNVNVVYRK